MTMVHITNVFALIYNFQANIKITRLTNPLQVSNHPFWDNKTRSIYFVDIHESTVYRYVIDTSEKGGGMMELKRHTFLLLFNGARTLDSCI